MYDVLQDAGTHPVLYKSQALTGNYVVKIKVQLEKNKRRYKNTIRHKTKRGGCARSEGREDSSGEETAREEKVRCEKIREGNIREEKMCDEKNREGNVR